MTERITSRRNPLLEQVRRLDTAALRRKAGVFLCDSPKLVGEAVQHGVSVQCVIAADGVAFPEGLPENVRRVTVPADVMASVIVLQTLHGMSDSETTDAITFDLRWKAAVGWPLTAKACAHVACGGAPAHSPAHERESLAAVGDQSHPTSLTRAPGAVVT